MCIPTKKPFERKQLEVDVDSCFNFFLSHNNKRKQEYLKSKNCLHLQNYVYEI